MIINVLPLIGFNDIQFGADREIVRKSLGEYREFKKSRFSKNTTDNFEFCHVFYTVDNKFEAIEFFEEAELYIADVKFFPITKEKIKEVFPDIEEQENSFISKTKSIGIELNGDKVESILFGTENYYE